MNMSDEWVEGIDCGTLQNGYAQVVEMPSGRTIAVFYWDGKYFATDNQCPHMGFPLEPIELAGQLE